MKQVYGIWPLLAKRWDFKQNQCSLQGGRQWVGSSEVGTGLLITERRQADKKSLPVAAEWVVIEQGLAELAYYACDSQLFLLTEVLSEDACSWYVISTVSPSVPSVWSSDSRDPTSSAVLLLRYPLS